MSYNQLLFSNSIHTNEFLYQSPVVPPEKLHLLKTQILLMDLNNRLILLHIMQFLLDMHYWIHHKSYKVELYSLSCIVIDSDEILRVNLMNTCYKWGSLVHFVYSHKRCPQILLMYTMMKHRMLLPNFPPCLLAPF